MEKANELRKVYTNKSFGKYEKFKPMTSNHVYQGRMNYTCIESPYSKED
jgi:hypothetical protein